MSVEPTMASSKPKKDKSQKKKKTSFLADGAKSIWGVAIVLALIASAATFAIISQVTARTTYWVMKQNVAARTPITPGMLQEVETSKNGAPKVGLTPAMVARGNLYSKVALQAGDVPSTTTVGPLERINQNIPANMVVASFTLDADAAVGGKIRAGDYIDIIAEQGDGAAAVSKIVLYRVKVLDVTIAPTNIQKAAAEGQEGKVTDTGPESAVLRSGIPNLYVVAVTPTDAAKLNSLRGSKMSAVLSSNEAQPQLDASVDKASIFAKGPVGSSSEGIESGQAAQGNQASPTAQPSASATQN